MALSGDWWSDYRRALRAYEALLPSALRELPALAGTLWRDANRAEQESRNLEAELASRDRRLAELTEQAGRIETELAARDRHLAQLGDHAGISKPNWRRVTAIWRNWATTLGISKPNWRRVTAIWRN